MGGGRGGGKTTWGLMALENTLPVADPVAAEVGRIASPAARKHA